MCRLYMLTHKIDFHESLVSLSDWKGGEKARVTEQQNPSGHLPVLLINGQPHAEHISVCRYLARKVSTVALARHACMCTALCMEALKRLLRQTRQITPTAVC
jgi:glutathione S-transferase